jgi:hypothetical protein
VPNNTTCNFCRNVKLFVLQQFITFYLVSAYLLACSLLLILRLLKLLYKLDFRKYQLSFSRLVGVLIMYELMSLVKFKRGFRFLFVFLICLSIYLTTFPERHRYYSIVSKVRSGER